jgi:hypothetical protein
MADGITAPRRSAETCGLRGRTQGAEAQMIEETKNAFRQLFYWLIKNLPADKREGFLLEIQAMALFSLLTDDEQHEALNELREHVRRKAQR